MPYKSQEELERIAQKSLRDLTDDLMPSEQAYVLAAMLAEHALMLKRIGL